MNFLAIDFETANYSRDSACSIGLVKVLDGSIVEKQVHLIRPPQKQFAFTHIHGIRYADVANAPTFGEIFPKFSSLFDGVEFLAAHNASFDKGVLKACCERYGLNYPARDFVCTMKLAREKWSLRPTKLSDVCRFLKIELNHHEALSDALACAQIVLRARGLNYGKAEVSPSTSI